MNVEILFTYKDAIAAGILMTLKNESRRYPAGAGDRAMFFFSKDKNRLYF